MSSRHARIVWGSPNIVRKWYLRTCFAHFTFKTWTMAKDVKRRIGVILLWYIELFDSFGDLFLFDIHRLQIQITLKFSNPALLASKGFHIHQTHTWTRHQALLCMISPKLHQTSYLDCSCHALCLNSNEFNILVKYEINHSQSLSTKQRAEHLWSAIEEVTSFDPELQYIGESCMICI